MTNWTSYSKTWAECTKYFSAPLSSLKIFLDAEGGSDLLVRLCGRPSLVSVVFILRRCCCWWFQLLLVSFPVFVFY